MNRPRRLAGRLPGPLLAVLVAATAGTGAAQAATHLRLPLRDRHVTTAGPRPGWALACAPAAAGPPAASRPWISGRTWDPAARPTVDGSVAWPDGLFSIRPGGAMKDFAGNGRPVATTTGSFPPAPGDDASAYAGPSAALHGHDVAGSLRAAPVWSRTPWCLAADQPVAIALDGTPIRAPFSATGEDAGAREVTDACGGRTDAGGVYAYPAGPRCLGRRGSGTVHSGLVGYARDGFRVYGPRGEGGRRLRTKDLDACHGHTHLLNANGERRRVYHYHLTPDFPYAVGCFRGQPSGDWQIGQQPAGLPPSPFPPAGPPGPVAVSLDPALFPTFTRDAPDYVTRCAADTPVRVTVTAEGGTLVSVAGGIPRGDGFTTSVSLAPGQSFDFTVDGGPDAGTYHVRCLPDDFPDWTVQRPGDPQAGWYIVTPSGSGPTKAIVFDNRGVPVWWKSGTPPNMPFNASLLSNGDLVWMSYPGGGFGKTPDAQFEEHSLDGKLQRTYRAVGSPTDLHEFQPLPGGHVLILTYRERDHVDLSAYGEPADATVVDGEIQELDADGNVVWSWNSKDHIPLSDSSRWLPGQPAMHMPDGKDVYDPVHVNSVDPHGDKLIVSLRHTDAVYQIDRATGAVDWKLGGTTTSASLAIVGDSLAATSFGGQHDARMSADGHYLTLHDNGTGRGRAPRVVRYLIDPAAKTATLVDELRDPDIPSSFCCGSARRLRGGDWVVSWGSTPRVEELASSGARVFALDFAGRLSYRAFPVPPGGLDPAALRAGMDAMAPSTGSAP